MTPESFDIYASSSQSASIVVYNLYKILYDFWPSVCGYIELDREEDIDFESGAFPKHTLPSNCIGAYFSRDKSMYDDWDWGVITTEHFNGEGPVSVYSSKQGGPALTFCLSLPDDPDTNSFSRKILDRILQSMPDLNIEPNQLG